jgi:hypothetical protein
MNTIIKYPELLKLYERNSPEIKTKILKLLDEPTSDADCVGWIYGFYSPKDIQYKNDFWIKLGRTERNPFTRVENEWNGTLIFCIKSSYNHRLESIVHLFFNFVRENRINICDKKSKFVVTSSVINRIDSPCEKSSCSFFERLFSCFKKRSKQEETQINYPLEKEWFHFKECLNVLALVSQICELVEDTFEGELLLNTRDNSIKSKIIKKQNSKININNSSCEELMNLPLSSSGMSKKMANKIIKHRKMLKFTHIEEIKLVDHKFNINYNKIKNIICV